MYLEKYTKKGKFGVIKIFNQLEFSDWRLSS